MKKNFLYILPILVSCTVGKDYQPPKMFDDNLIQESIGLNFNEEFKDNFFSPYDFGDSILNNLMDTVQEESPSIQIAILRLKQARESLNINSKNSYPFFDFMGKYNFVNESKNIGALFDSDYYEVGIDMNWEIDIFGGNRRKSERSKALFMSELFNLKNTNVSLVAEVANIYINLRNSEQQLKNAIENLEVQTEAYNIILDQYKVSLTDEITVAQSKYLLETTKMKIPELEYQCQLYTNALAVLLGKLPIDMNNILKNSVDKNLVEDVFNYNIEKLYELPISVIRNRPDVKVAEYNLIAQNAEVGVAISKLYPSFSLSGFLGFQSTNSGNLIKRDSRTNSLIPNINLPIFHWGQLKDNIRIQEFLKEEMLLNYENTLLTAVSEVKNAIVAIEKEYQKNKSIKEAYENMQLVSELNWKKYTLGLVGFGEVLDAEQRRISAQTEMVNSNANLYSKLITFYKSIGGKPIEFNDKELEDKV